MSLGNIEQRTEGLKKQAQELIDFAYQRGYKAGQENAFAVDSDKFREQGRNEAWEAARKLVSMGYEECNEVFGDGVLTVETIDELFVKCTASEAIEKISAYEEQKKQGDSEEFKIGDEVINTTGDRGVVLGISKKDVFLFILGWNIPQVTNKLCCKKTGRTFPEIAEVLKNLTEDEDCCNTGTEASVLVLK